MTNKKSVTSPTSGDAGSKKSGAKVTSGDDVAPEIFKEMQPDPEKALGMRVSMGVGPVMHPWADKINDKHIHKILEITEKRDDQTHQEKSKSRWFKLAYVAIGAAIFVFLTIFMVGSHTEVYMKLLEYVVPFLGGVGGGVWLKSYWDRKG